MEKGFLFKRNVINFCYVVYRVRVLKAVKLDVSFLRIKINFLNLRSSVKIYLDVCELLQNTLTPLKKAENYYGKINN